MARARRVGGPLVSGTERTDARSRGRQILAEIAALDRQRIELDYRRAEKLRELSQPAVYRDGLGHASFEQALEAHGLGSRMQAHKDIKAVSNFTMAGVVAIGGVGKASELVKANEAISPGEDPRRLALPGARLAGREVRTMTRTDIGALMRRGGRPRPTTTSAHAKRMSARARRAFKRAEIASRTRVHRHDEAPCVAVHLEPLQAGKLADVVRRGVSVMVT